MIYLNEEYILWNLIYSNAKKQKLIPEHIIYLFKKSIENQINIFRNIEDIKLTDGEIIKYNNALEYFKEKIYLKYNENISKILKKCEKNKIFIMNYEDEKYPLKFKQISTPPILFYYKGKLPKNDEKILTIAGSRNISQYGKIIVDRVVKLFSDQHYLILSGLAAGIDTQSHLSALKNYSTTLAILGQGLGTQIYPKENIEIANKILETHGCLISEIEPYKRPNRDYFLLRNRLQAALADKIFIGEIKETGGGTLTTINYSIQYNKDLYIWNPVKLNKINESFLGNLIIFDKYESTNKKNRLLLHKKMIRKNAIEVTEEKDFYNNNNNTNQLKLF